MAKKAENTETLRNSFITEEDRKFIERVKNDYEYAKEKKPIDKWQKYDEYVEDDQWDVETNNDSWKPRPQVNICWAAIRTIHANMTSGKVAISVTCTTPGYDDIAANLNDVINYYWEALDMDMQMSESEWIRPKIGSVAIKSVWNPNKNNGDGDLDCEIVHPSNVFIDPRITNPWKVQKAEFIDFVTPVSIRYIVRKYSKNNDKMCKYVKEELKRILVPDSDTSDTEIYGDFSTQSNNKIPADIRGTTEGSKQDSYNSKNTIKLHEYWYKDDNNKLQVAWIAGDVLLKHTIDDEEIKNDGFYRHGRYPIVYIPYIQKDKRLDGRSELQSLVGTDSKRDGIQDIINKLIQDYIVNERLVGQGQIAYRHGAVKNPEKLTGEAGLLIPVKGNPYQDIARIQGKNLNELLPVIDSMLTHADRITGQWDITQGRTTPAVKTLGQTSLLMEQAMKPQNDKVNTLNHGLRELIELWIEHLAEFVTEDREYTKPDAENGVETFTFNPSTILSAPRKILQIDGEGNKFWGEDKKENKKSDEEGETRRLYLKAKVDIGASLAMTKAYMIEIAFSLWNSKLIDMEGAYKLLPEFPGKAETLERMKEQQAKAEQQALLQQQVQGQGQQANGQAQAQGQSEVPSVPDQTEIAQFVEAMPPEMISIMQSMSEQEQGQYVMQLMAMPPDQLEQYINTIVDEMNGGNGGEMQNEG